MKRKININLPEDLITKIDERANSMYITRTAYIITALMQKMQSEELVDSLPELKKAINDIKNLGNNLIEND